MLSPGARFGAFEIQAALGAGGMGEVYRARDTKLARDVALKLLPDAFADDVERVARFEREAQVLAALNHQHIAHIYGLEDGRVDGRAVRALVMELVEGATLAERMTAAPLALEEALTIARQIAEALEAAHEKGITHRDLKPANVMLTGDGSVKVLDFGLATVAPSAAATHPDSSQSPTLTIAATRAGVIMGTAGYMSPEQAAGKPVDKRADIWSFGVIVWEMLAGRRLFDGETISHTLADVLRAEIDFSRLPRNTPHAIRELLRRCLDRDAKRRLRDVGEARVAIQSYLASPASAATIEPRSGARSPASYVPWAIAAVAIALAAVLAFIHSRERPQAIEAMRFQILPPEQTTMINSIVLSPDGRSFVFQGTAPDGSPMLWLRSLNSTDVRPLTGTENATAGFFWSPDSRTLAFATNGFPGRLKKVDVNGGPPQTICEFTGSFRGGAWSPNGVILFGSGASGLWQISEKGGTPTRVTTVLAARAESQHSGPAFLPDGRSFLYYRATTVGGGAEPGIYVGSLDVKPDAQSTTRVLVADSDPVYVPSPDDDSGLMLSLREGTLVAQRVDRRGQSIGNTISVAQDVGSLGHFGWFSASATGQLSFRTGRAAVQKNQLVWFDRHGKRLGELGAPIELGAGGVQLSKDGRRVTITRTVFGEVQGAHVWIAEVSRGIFTQLDTGDASASAPAVSPNGFVAFSSTMNGAVGDIYWTPGNGIGSPEPLLLKSPTVKHPNNFSPDGKFLVYDDHIPPQDLYVLPIAAPPGGGERKPIPFVATKADETFGQFSPDGKWIAYSSDETGRREVYVQGFAPDKIPATAVGKWTISTAGGDKPRWSADGKELFYIALDRKMMAVPVKLTPTFEPGVPVSLFETNVTAFNPYDVSPDGRFLLNTLSGSAAPTASPVTIVLNWQSGLKR
jgi:eukaryotic-like serine/threonine-protein kinase